MKPVAVYKDTSFGLDHLLKGKTRVLELCAWLGLLFFCNHTLLQGRMADHLVFFPSLVTNGEWYRAALSPFVHISFYHLALDAAAFLFLWKGLDEGNTGARWIYLLFCWAGSLLVPLMISKQVHLIGLCGLSGVSHGLFAVVALELMVLKDSKQARKVGLILFSGLLAKVIWEVVNGAAFLAGMHLASVGTPIVSSHLGGFLGGWLGFVVIHMAYILNKVNQFRAEAQS
jgi:rhomboid family GlyGly-CTERM serine protease